MALFHLLGQDDEKEMQNDIFGNVMPMASSMVPLHLFGHTNQTEVQPSFLGHVIPLMMLSLSQDINIVINGTIPFVRF